MLRSKAISPPRQCAVINPGEVAARPLSHSFPVALLCLFLTLSCQWEMRTDSHLVGGTLNLAGAESEEPLCLRCLPAGPSGPRPQGPAIG